MTPGGDSSDLGYDETDPRELARRTVRQADEVRRRAAAGDIDPQEALALIGQIQDAPILLDRFPGPPRKVTHPDSLPCLGCGTTIPAGLEHVVISNPLIDGPARFTHYCRRACIPRTPIEEP
ncbi:MAG: hypothetical protein GY856_36830 [bacterium]|nr:hypothetical protein [bacterium]